MLTRKTHKTSLRKINAEIEGTIVECVSSPMKATHTYTGRKFSYKMLNYLPHCHVDIIHIFAPFAFSTFHARKFSNYSHALQIYPAYLQHLCQQHV